MSRQSNAFVPRDEFDRFVKKLEDIMYGNPLNNASVDSGPGISAGSYQVSPAGVIMPWSGGPEPVHDVVGRVQGDAAAAQSRADQAYDAQAVKPTTLYVDARDAANATAASNAHSRANAAYSLADGKAGSGTVAALAQRVASLEASRVQFVQLFSQIIVAMEVRSGYTRPTPPNANG